MSAKPHQTEYTVDQLARDAGLPVSTVRMYQQRGLIEPPEKRGRVGYYNNSHQQRLQLVARLQQRGFSLAAIKESIDSWNSGASLDEMLRVGDLAPSLTTKPLVLSPSQLADRFADVDLDQADITRAVHIGLIELQDATVLITNPAFADIGPEVARLGITVGEMLDEYEVLRSSVEEIADRFRSVFERHFWKTFVDNGMRPEDIPDLTDAASKLAKLATASVSAELNGRFGEYVQEYLQQAEDVQSMTEADPGRPSDAS